MSREIESDGFREWLIDDEMHDPDFADAAIAKMWELGAARRIC